MTQDLYQSAIKFAGEKHKHQTVPGTESNYLQHISNVAMEILMAYAYAKDFDVDFAVQAAILHDTIEDTDATFEELKAHFGERVANAVLALSKNDSLPSKSEKMADSLFRINALEKEVGMVKMADRITNLQAPPAHWSTEKITDYYWEAITIANGLKGKNEYLGGRLVEKIEAYKRFIG